MHHLGSSNDMSDALKPNPFTTAAVAGIVTQIALSSTFEVPTVKFLAFSGISDAVLLGYLIATAYAASSNTNLLHVALHFLRLNVIFFSTLTIATAIRRLFFHPLRNFPGKKVQALSALYQARITLKGQSSLGVLKQHRELGDFVRTGPNELSINNVSTGLCHQQEHTDWV